MIDLERLLFWREIFLMNQHLMKYFVRLIVLLTAMPVHEFAHGYVATKLGDDTPRLSGRLTLNPTAHLDFMGSLMIMFFGIGYAKPVPINPYNFKNSKKGIILTSVAGPCSNIILAFILMIFYKIFAYVNIMVAGNLAFLGTLSSILAMMVSVNVSLAIFNLLPLYPLDGSKIFIPLLPEKYQYWLEENSNVITLVLFAFLFLGILDRPLFFLSNFIIKLLGTLTGFIDHIFLALY